MPQIGPLEVLVVAFVALMVFGPQKLPGMARSAGKSLYELKRAMGDMKREFTEGLEDDEVEAAQPKSAAASGETSSDEEPS
jgi:sec-independent protein translocase protein TatA